jgi:hypothetical protein
MTSGVLSLGGGQNVAWGNAGRLSRCFRNAALHFDIRGLVARRRAKNVPRGNAGRLSGPSVERAVDEIGQRIDRFAFVDVAFAELAAGHLPM